MRLVAGREFSGPAGHATEVITEIEADDRPDLAATVATWFFKCPGQSPAWDNYLLTVIHLRPIEGVKDATIVIPGATHQVLMAALDPSKQPEPLDVMSWQHLSPLNADEQLELPDDRSAQELAAHVALGVVDGVLPAEPALSGAVEPWRSSLIKTAAHLRGEAHAE